MPIKKGKKRPLHERLVADGLAPDRAAAEAEILAGLVRVNGERVDKAGTPVSDSAQVTAEGKRLHVGRGALKLEEAFAKFSIDCTGAVCADVGACTGGFTEVLLKQGALKVFAIDVGYGDLDWKIRSDPRVVVMERTNARHLESLPEPVSFVVIDVSFISLDKILPVVARWMPDGGTVVALVKPQFEAERTEVGEGGIVRDPAVHARVVTATTEALPSWGLEFKGVVDSPILGGDGNREFLIWAEKKSASLA